MEAAKQERESHPDEIETKHPGYLLSQDTFYVEYLKGVGRIYQQTVVNTYSSVTFAKVYTAKIPVTVSDVLNDQVLPSFEDHEMPVLRVLTDRVHQTILNEFYRVTFRKKVYSDLEALQMDLNKYMNECNYKRTHQGKRCQGRTPMESFLESKKYFLEKNLSESLAA
ncbi:MAG: hypothetical protein A2157_02205 [Deltaproteobacteria bacterium RBG_16_47_11]|nr:MAG: hypothetical protein A2157_02205 [Deltaproteobacteria bacterium RBG_16_47_11]